MATYPLTWLADVLRAAGCRVVEEDGWKTRGRDGSFAPKAIMMHHDASPAGETSNGVDVIRDGRPGLGGPLSQLWLAYDGTWHVVAAGRANHAGEGGPWGVIAHDQGNRDGIGIETDHTTDEKWSDPQRSEGLRGVHALCQHMGIDTAAEIDRAVTAHKEYAPDRKVDPDPMDMDNARHQLATYEADRGVLGMSEIAKFSRTKAQTIDDDAWQTVKLNDDDALSFVSGATSMFVATAYPRIQGLPAGAAAQFRFVAVSDFTGDKATVVDQEYPPVEVIGSAGDAFGQVVWANDLGDSPHSGGTAKLRLQALAPQGAPFTITRLTARALT
jgi:hypothetical protein